MDSLAAKSDFPGPPHQIWETEYTKAVTSDPRRYKGAPPRVILADEATGNLDPANKSAILDLLFEAVRTDGATLVAVTHDHDLLPRIDRVVDFRDFT